MPHTYINKITGISIPTVKNYYQLLQSADEVENASRNYDNFRYLYRRSVNYADAGRIPPVEVDQAEQRELTARDNWVRAIERYESALDDFKLLLGIPTDVVFEPDPAELEKLQLAGIVPVNIALEDAIAHALENRLDMKNEYDQLEDAERSLKVAENDLKPGLDLVLSYDADTPAKQPLNFADGDYAYGAGVDFDLPSCGGYYPDDIDGMVIDMKDNIGSDWADYEVKFEEHPYASGLADECKKLWKEGK